MAQFINELSLTMLKIICVGAGYFAPFHIEAWTRISGVELLAICDLDKAKAQQLAKKYHISKVYTNIRQMLEEQQADVIDIITPPSTHLLFCKLAIEKGLHIICQKPLAPTLSEARQIVSLTEQATTRFMVHENFRFQPWYRKIKQLIEAGEIGEQMHQLYFRMRMGDGWQEDAYLSRQPYFRTMPRLLIHETGIHFIDTFRYLMGEITTIESKLRRLNPNIAGEDTALLFFEFENGALGVFDASRYHESKDDNARYTFGEMLLEGNKGAIRLYNNGKITLQQLGKTEVEISYRHEDRNFSGDCVYFTQKHFVDSLVHDLPFETNGLDYLKNLEWEEQIYQQDKY